MPHFTSSDEPPIAENSRRSMSSLNAALPKIDEGTAMTGGGFSLFPDTKPGEHQSEHDNYEQSSDGTDPTQIEAALEALMSVNGTDTSDVAYPTRGQKDESSQAMSPDESKKRAQYFEDQFSYKEAHGSSGRERVLRDSPIIAELRTNVIVKDEFTLVTDMSYHLSTRFARPESSIMINIDHSACLLLAGSFEPAYILTISALPSQVQPTLNKRNAALIQSFMVDVLSVAADRGIIRFIPVPEANLAINGATVFGEIERVEKQQAELNTGLTTTSREAAKRTFSRKSITSIKRQTTATATTLHPDTLNLENNHSMTSLIASPPIPQIPSPPLPSGVLEPSVDDKRRSANGMRMNGQHLTKRNSAHSTLQKAGPVKNGNRKSHGSNYWTLPKPPPIPQEEAPPKTSKRKSLFAVFRKGG